MNGGCDSVAVAQVEGGAVVRGNVDSVVGYVVVNGRAVYLVCR